MAVWLRFKQRPRITEFRNFEVAAEHYLLFSGFTVLSKSVLLCQFALFEVITEFGNGHSPRLLRPVMAIDF